VNNISAWILLIGLSAIVGSGFPRNTASAQSPRDAVLDDAEDVFSRPEFQRFRNLKPAEFEESRLTPSRGGTSGKRGAGGGRGDGESAEANGESRNTSKDEVDGPEDDSEDDDRQQTAESQESNVIPRGSFGDFGAGMAALFKVLGIVMLVVMVVLILWMIVTSLINREKPLAESSQEDLLTAVHRDTAEPTRTLSAEEYLNQANHAAEQGQYRNAVAYVLLAAMMQITNRGAIKPRIGLTVRDYYRAVRRTPRVGGEFLKILKTYEPLAFGRRVAERHHFETCQQAYQAGFRETETIS